MSKRIPIAPGSSAPGRPPAGADPLISAVTHAMDHALAAYRGGDWATCEQLCRLILKAQRDHGEALNLLGAIAAQTGRSQEAAQLLARAVAVQPQNAAAHLNHGNLLQSLKRHDEALRRYEQALKIKPDYAEAHYHRGNVLTELGRFDEAMASYDKALRFRPDLAEAYANRAHILQRSERFEEALDSYQRALQVRPNDAQAHYQRGNVLKRLRRHTEALQSYERAIKVKPDFPEPHNNRGNLLLNLKRFAEAIESYDRAIEVKPDYADAFNNRGIALQESRRTEAALESYERALRIDATHADAHCNRGTVLKELKRFDESLESFARALEIRPEHADALANRAGTLKELKRLDQALESYRHALELKPDYEWLYGSWLHTRMQLCDWRDWDRDIAELESKIAQGKAVTPPFPVLALTDSPGLQRRAAELWVEGKHPASRLLAAMDRYPRHDRIRVGYFSGDFRDHPISTLMADLLERHDRSRFEVYGFSFGPDTRDDTRQRMERAFDRFFDVHAASDADIARLARSMQLDIAVDLGGFTDSGRPNVFALRAAPLQAAYLGYLGTSGAEYMDYLLADATIVPPGAREHYTESIVYLPSYQPNDTKRVISQKRFTREELGLPSEGFVFCCFNAVYKITPATFDGWMRILNRVPGSSLLLLGDLEQVERNLRGEADKRGVAGGRLAFGKRLPMPDYLARYRAADLFLDTLPYNAGTTASDALWSGLPVLTRPGEAFAGRVAASLLTAIGLPELIVSTQDLYESTAVELALDRQRLAALRNKVDRNRSTSPLFDAGLSARSIESAYTQMYERHQAGLEPEHLQVTR